MPSFSGSMAATTRTSKPVSNIVTINVGGQLFQTTRQTLSTATQNSLLHSLSHLPPSTSPTPFFIDRDPDLFSLLLSLLRKGHLPSKSKAFHPQDLLSESQFYGIPSYLLHPPPLDPSALRFSSALPLPGRDTPSSLSTTPSGSLHLAHGSKISAFDSSLRRGRTILTHFSAVDSLLSLSPSLVAAGATDISGLQILDTQQSLLTHTLSWDTPTVSTVRAVASSPHHLFTSFESARRTSNAIMVYDLASGDLLPSAEIGRREVYGAALEDSDLPATKLCWVPSRGLLLAAGSHSGPCDTTGMVRLWDLRCAAAVWEVREKVDCFSDVAVWERMSAILKVGVKTGELFFADMRMLGGSGWVRVGEGEGGEGGGGSRVECCGEQVFRTRGGEVEMWSEVVVGRGEEEEERVVMKRNGLGMGKNKKKSRISEIKFGGGNMFLCRKDQQWVEVWHS